MRKVTNNLTKDVDHQVEKLANILTDLQEAYVPYKIYTVKPTGYEPAMVRARVRDAAGARKKYKSSEDNKQSISINSFCSEKTSMYNFIFPPEINFIFVCSIEVFCKSICNSNVKICNI